MDKLWMDLNISFFIFGVWSANMLTASKEDLTARVRVPTRVGTESYTDAQRQLVPETAYRVSNGYGETNSASWPLAS